MGTSPLVDLGEILSILKRLGSNGSCSLLLPILPQHCHVCVLCFGVYKTLQELALGLRLQAEDCFQTTVRDISRIGYVPQLKDKAKPELLVPSTHMVKSLHVSGSSPTNPKIKLAVLTFFTALDVEVTDIRIRGLELEIPLLRLRRDTVAFSLFFSLPWLHIQIVQVSVPRHQYHGCGSFFLRKR
jgi:hypothetical protein